MKSPLTIATPLVAMRLQIARIHGIDTASVLKRAGLKAGALRNPLGRLTLDRDNAIWREIVAATGDPAIGLRLGRYFKLHGFGIVGYLMMNVDTVFEGMQRFCKYQRLITNAYRSETIRDEDSLAYVTYYEGDWQPERRCTLDFIMSSTRQLAVDVGIDIPAVKQVCFQYDRPADLAPYAAVFGNANLQFGCADTRFVFVEEAAETPVIGANPELLEAFDLQAKALLAEYDRESFSDRVRQAITQNLQGATPALGEIAGALNLSPRSLQMKLQEEGTSYQTLLDEVRKDMAIAYLRGGDLKKTEIAYLLGFSQASAFSRKFKRWTGKAPSAFQK